MIDHVFEPGLEELMRQEINKNLTFGEPSSELPVDIHIITVGTPIDPTGEPDLTALQAATLNVAKNLSVGNMVLLRSTYHGDNADFVKKLLEKYSHLSCGTEFSCIHTRKNSRGSALSELIATSNQ